MRAHTPAEAALLDGRHYAVHVECEMQDATGTWRWLSGGDAELGAGSWFLSATWREALEQAVATGTLTLRRSRTGRDNVTRSLAALMRDVPLVEVGHGVRLYTTCYAPGTVPQAADRRCVFDGRVTDHDVGGVRFGGDPDTITCQLADRFATLGAAQVKAATVYGSDAGTPLADALRAVLADWTATAPGGIPALGVPVDPQYAVRRYEQQPQSVAEALTTLAALRGAYVRGVWTGAAGTAGVYALTLVIPTRAPGAPVLTVPKSRVLAIPRQVTSDADLRTDVEVAYTDAGTGAAATYTASRPAVRARPGIGERFMRLVETGGRMTAAEAQRYAEAAADDLSAPTFSHEAEIRYDWRLQVGDVVRYTANGLTYAADQVLATAGLTHTLSATTARTAVQATGTARGPRSVWFDRDAELAMAAAPELPGTARTVATPSSNATQTTAVVRTVPAGGTVRLVSTTAVRLGGPAPGVNAPDDTAWVFQRAPYVGANPGDDTSAEFAAVVGGVEDRDVVVIPAQGRDTLPLLLQVRKYASTATAEQYVVSASVPYTARNVALDLVDAGGTAVRSQNGPSAVGQIGVFTASTVQGQESPGQFAFALEIDRPPAGSPSPRVIFRVRADGCVPDIDIVDVLPQAPAVLKGDPGRDGASAPGAAFLAFAATPQYTGAIGGAIVLTYQLAEEWAGATVTVVAQQRTPGVGTPATLANVASGTAYLPEYTLRNDGTATASVRFTFRAELPGMVSTTFVAIVGYRRSGPGQPE